MICFKCNNETDFEVQEIEVEQEYKNMLLNVVTPVTICKECGFQSLDIGQTNELMKRTKSRLHEVIENAIDYSVGY